MSRRIWPVAGIPPSLALALACFAAEGPGRQEPPWVQTNGPVGGVISTIEMHPTNPETLYAAGAGGCVFKSVNAGTTWTVLQQVTEPSTHIADLLMTPEDPDVMLARTDMLYRSTDGGQVWQAVPSLGGLSCVAISQSTPFVLVAGTGNGAVHRSLDGGETWTNITGNLPVHRIADVAVGAGNEVWAGTANGGNGQLYHTSDGGVSWQMIAAGQRENTDVNTIFVDGEDSTVLYVGFADPCNEVFSSATDRYLLKTEDNGQTWRPLYLPGVDAMVNVMGRAPGDAALYVGSGGNAFRSLDGGRSWSWISPPGRNGDMRDIAVDPRDFNMLFLPRQAHGIVKSTDRGATWARINEGLTNVSVCLLSAPNVPGSATVYAAAVSGEGVAKTTDSGASWTNVTENGITHPWGDEMVVSPHDPGTVWYAADVGEVFRTTDGGASWQKTINPYGDGFRFGSAYAVAPAPSAPKTIYALKNGFGIFKSTDGGESWRFLHQSEVDYTYTIAVHPTDAGIVYSGYIPKPFQDWAMVRQTTDGGESWRTALTVPGSGGITSVVMTPDNPGTVYAGSMGRNGGQVYKSTDGGDSWTKLNEHFTMCTVWGQSQLAIHPQDPSTVYAGTWLAGTWKTTDAGQTWTLLEDAPISATALSLNPLDPDVVYLADRSTPTVWKSSNAGDSWEEVADFRPDGALLVMRVLARGDTVYAATFHPSLTGGRMYKSTNAGSAWCDITDNLPKGILDIALDPTNPTVVYVTTNINGAHKSLDGGATWAPLPGFPDAGAYDIEVHPADSQTLYAAARGGSLPAWFTEIAGDQPDGVAFDDPAGVYRSTDGGLTWHNVLTTSASCRAIRAHPTNPNMLFAVDLVDGLQVSTNSGDSWAPANVGLDTIVLTSCAVGDDKIYVGTQGCGVYSGDLDLGAGTVTWQPGRSNKPVPEVFSLQLGVDPTDSDRLFVSAYPGGLYRSDDGGVTFRDKNGITPSVVVDDPLRQGYYTFAMNPADTDEMWLGTWGKGVFKSFNAMSLDIPAHGTDMKMVGKHVYQILVHPGSGTVYAATEEGIFKTDDGGKTWHEFSVGLGTPQVRTLAVTAEGDLICGTLGYELYRCGAYGSEWVQMPGFGQFGTLWPIWDDRPLYQYTSILFHPTEASVVYAGTFPAGIFKSTDDGQTWRENNVGWTNDGVFSLVLHPENPDVVYAGTYNGVNRSTDNAGHWLAWDQGWPDEQWVFSIDFDPRSPDVMYACSKNGENEGTGRPGFRGTVMKSTDAGENWFSITNGLDLDQEFYKIIVDKHDPDVVYLASQRDGVLISRNGGAGWTPWNDGLTNVTPGTNGNNVTDTLIMSADGFHLYLGTAGSGVFRRRINDADNDRLPDPWETRYGLHLDRDDSQEDPDSDFLTNQQEHQNSTDPKSRDTDGDGAPDWIEVLAGSSPTQSMSLPAKPVSSGTVQVSGRQILVGDTRERYQIRGVGYQPTPIGQHPASYNCYQQALYERDLPLLRRMSCNTIRTWGKINNDDGFLDACWNNGEDPIRVVAGYWIDQGTDFTDASACATLVNDFKDYVSAYKDHPAILMWLPGGEINYYLKDDGPALKAWFSLLNELAWAAYEIEGTSYHPVTTDLAADVWDGVIYTHDLVTTQIGSSVLAAGDTALSGLDVWGINSYRGATFETPERRGDLFADYAALSAKPMWLAEYGADAWDRGAAVEAERTQADRNRALWDIINANSDICCGGSIMAYSDEWWKNSQQGTDWSTHDAGPWQRGDQPDGWTDEEYYGIVAVLADGSVRPRRAYYALGSAWGLYLPEIDEFWNLVSVPCSSDQTITDVVADAKTGSAWLWDALRQAYAAAADSGPFTALTGYWIWGQARGVTQPLYGTLADASVTLKKGWNLVGPLGHCSVDELTDILGTIWTWDAATESYVAVSAGELLEPGRAYWIYAPADCTIELGP